MRKTTPHLVLLVAFVVTAALAISCGDDPVTPTVIPDCFLCFENFSKKSDIFSNIEYAYNKRKMQMYDEMLDDNFTFFYTEPGVGVGTPVQWGRADEVTTTSGLLAAASSIDLTIDWKDSEGHSTVQWTQQISGTETWYYTTVFYHYTIKIGDTTYIPLAGAKAQFTVRNAGTDEKPVWKLVEFRDLGGPSLAAMRVSATEPTTWGQVKAKYRN